MRGERGDSTIPLKYTKKHRRTSEVCGGYVVRERERHQGRRVRCLTGHEDASGNPRLRLPVLK